MRLYHHPMSSNARRAAMTALHLGVDLELVLVDLSKDEQHSASFLKLNPSGRVPVLVDDGFALTESHAIMQYLADKTPGQTLFPKEPRARADVNRWMFWSAQHFQPAVSVFGWENFVKPMIGRGDPDPVEIARGTVLMNDASRVLDDHLAGKTWVVGKDVTLADYAIAASLGMAKQSRLPIGDRANLLAWFERVQALEPWKKTAFGPPPNR